MKKRVLVVSSANIDFVQRVKRMPDGGETVIEQNGYSYVPGGKGANSALAFARVGADTVFCTKMGKDDNAKKLKKLYEAEGIDTRFIGEDREEATGLASIIVEEDGQNRIIVYPGANNCLCENDVEEAFTCYPDGVFIQFEIPDEASVAAARFARENGIPFFVDAGPARADYPLEKLQGVEILSPNETECEILTGIKPDSVQNCLKAAIRLATVTEAKYVVLKLGRRGCFVYDGKYYNIIPAHKVSVADTTAAGDVFTAALSYAYMQKGDILEAARFATLAAAICVSREGASTSIPTLKEIKAFAKSIKEAK
ncbi:MAG: ribokinase [Ruminococcaceae bacterium]|nr:ribokinase [Oscillospiraceae bacterium]